MDEERYDLIVAGAGLAGMTAAARAASLGLSVLLAGSSSALVFSSGLMDYLGIYPPGSKTFLKHPDQGLKHLAADFPGHAYAVAGKDKTLAGFSFTADLLNARGLPYVLSKGENICVITAMGTVKPSFLVPAAMTLEGRGVPEVLKERGGHLVVAGLQGLPGFSAAQVIGGLGEAGRGSVPVQVRLPGIQGVVPPQIMAGLMADEKQQAAWVAQVMPHAKNALAVGVPAVFGIEDHLRIMATLAEKLGCPVFEIPCAPPSIPGLRLESAFQQHLKQAGVTVLSNTRLLAPVFDGESFVLTAGVEPRGLTVRARGVVLATGRFFGHGLHARRERIVETLFHLNVDQPVRRSLWHDSRFLTPGGHGINQAGIKTDHRFRPVDERGRPVYRHLYAAGSILAFNDWARLKSGSGAAIASALAAVDAFYEEAGRG